VADNDDPTGGLTPGDALEDDVLDAARFDAEPFDDVTAALAQVSFLDPTTAQSEPPMPDWAWDKLSLAIGTEASARAAAEHDNVVPLNRTTEAPPSTRSSRGLKWAGGLVAASVAIVAVGVAVSSVQTTSGPSVVAGEAVQASLTGPAPASVQALVAQDKAIPGSADATAPLAAPAPASAQAFSTPTQSEPPTADAPATGPTPSFRSGPTIVQAARMVTATQTDYQTEQLPGQVRTLLSDVGVDSPKEASAMPTVAALPGGDGFTATWDRLRACINWLTHATDAQALVVDRGTFEGDAAGVVVAPADADNPDPSTPAPTVTVDTDQGRVDVWVVTPQCTHVDDVLSDLMPYLPGN